MNWESKTDQELVEIADRSDAIFGELMVRIFRLLLEIKEKLKNIPA